MMVTTSAADSKSEGEHVKASASSGRAQQILGGFPQKVPPGEPLPRAKGDRTGVVGSELWMVENPEQLIR